MKPRRDRFRLFCRRGASVLIALLVFFLVALSGTIALVMASSNAGRYTHEKKDQQAYLSTASAVRLILDKLTGLTITLTSANNVPEGPTFDPSKLTIEYKGGTQNLFLSDPRFENNLRLQSYSGWDETKHGFQPVIFTLSLTDTPDAGKVHVEMEMSKTSPDMFRLWYLDNDGSYKYQMTLSVPWAWQEKDNFNKYEEGEGEGKILYYSRTLEWQPENATYDVETYIPETEEDEG